MLCGIRLVQHDESYLRWGGATMPAPGESQTEARRKTRPTSVPFMSCSRRRLMPRYSTTYWSWLTMQCKCKVGSHKTGWEGTMSNEGLSIEMHEGQNKRISLEVHFWENFSEIFQWNAWNLWIFLLKYPSHWNNLSSTIKLLVKKSNSKCI